MFLDESGDHSLSAIDPQYPVFVLGGIIADKEYAEGPMAEAVARFKDEMGLPEDLVLHTSDISRNRDGFERVKEPEYRHEFFRRLNELMTSLEYKVVACVVRKDEHLARYGLAAGDPYMFSLDVLVERFCFEIGSGPPGVIVAESRNPTLDNQLELAWLNLKIQGTLFLRASKITSCVSSLNIREKKENIAGLQLADLVVSPIGRHVLGKSPKEDWAVIESKFRRRGGLYAGAGLVILPKG
jgi:hypothetical protein